jgi:hypothetical protein
MSARQNLPRARSVCYLFSKYPLLDLTGTDVTYQEVCKFHWNITAAFIGRDHTGQCFIVNRFDYAGVGERESCHGAEGERDLEKMH